MARPYTPASLADDITREAVDVLMKRVKRYERPGVIYFIACQDRVKIGFARELASRLARLQTFAPYPLTVMITISGTLGEEKALHLRFAEYRTHGEWFRLEGELANYIAGLPK